MISEGASSEPEPSGGFSDLEFELIEDEAKSVDVNLIADVTDIPADQVPTLVVDTEVVQPVEIKVESEDDATPTDTDEGGVEGKIKVFNFFADFYGDINGYVNGDDD